ncbi:transposable element Tcb1 transposase [Trichonephila clavipes]|nr:transposable element Tcb1 transposase [Trichonephila clavipes]
MKEGCGRQIRMKLDLLTSNAFGQQHYDGRIRIWRHRGERILNTCVMHPHTGPALGIMGLATAIFQQDNARSHVARMVQRFFVNHQIELLPWPPRSKDLSPIENMWSMIAQRLT